jgi:hypothetical protein
MVELQTHSLHKAGRKLAASTSPSDPNPSQSHERLTQSANRNTVERQQRGSTNNEQQQRQRRYEGKDKNKNRLTSVTCSKKRDFAGISETFHESFPPTLRVVSDIPELRCACYIVYYIS